MSQWTIDDVIEIVRAFDRSNLERLDLSVGPFALAVRRKAEAAAQMPSGTGEVDAAGEVRADSSSQSAHASWTAVTSPAVGIFRTAPEEGAPPFVQIGDAIVEGSVIGLVQGLAEGVPAVARFRGRVVDICVGDREFVEYGQALLYVQGPEERGDSVGSARERNTANAGAKETQR